MTSNAPLSTSDQNTKAVIANRLKEDRAIRRVVRRAIFQKTISSGSPWAGISLPSYNAVQRQRLGA